VPLGVLIDVIYLVRTEFMVGEDRDRFDRELDELDDEWSMRR
jgi:hypothetical protein